MAGKKSSDPIAEIKKAVGTKKFVMGTERTMKGLLAGKVAKVFVTVNCPEGVREDIARYASSSGAAVEEIPIPNDELGTICKKPFPISVVSMVKE